MRANLLLALLLSVMSFFVVSQINSCKRDHSETIEKEGIRYVHTSDTVTRVDSFIEYKEGPTRYVYLKPDTVYLDSNQYMNYTYHVMKPDLKANFTAVVDGTIVESNFNYSVMCPVKTIEVERVVTNTDSLIIEKYISAKKNMLFVGGSVGFDSTVTKIGLNATVKLKNDMQIFYQHNIRLNSNNEHEAGIKLPLKTKF